MRARYAAIVALSALVTIHAAAGDARAQMGMGPADPLHPGDSAPTRVVTPDLQFPPVVPGAVNPDRYVVGPGDVFQLNFSGAVTRTLWLTVGPEGMLFVPGAGAVMLDGLTLTAARREIARRLAGEFHGVDFDLRLARVRAMRIFLTGEVKQAGPVDVPAVARVSEVLPDAALTIAASRRNIEIRRRDGSRLVADLVRYNLTGNESANPALRDGDIVNVPVAKLQIEIQGAVGRPGVLELGPADSLSTLLEIAGGPLAAAREDGCLLVRWRDHAEADSLFFSLSQLVTGAFDPALRDGDHAYIYFVSRFHELEQATILGEVDRPGVYPLATGRTRLSELVAAAGGFLSRANLAAIRVYRADHAAADGDPELDRLLRFSRNEMSDAEYARLQTRLAARHVDFRVDWRRLQQAQELDFVLHAGDVVRVDPVLSTLRVDGEVRRPGLVEYDERRSVGDYIRLAGGFGQRAATGRVLVTRSVTGQTLRARDVGALSPGDLIWVPERPEKTVWQQAQTLIAVAAQVATLVFVVRR